MGHDSATSRPDEDTLNYNAMQLSVQRRLNRGLQMGVAYTLSKSEGIQGYDCATEELFGRAGPARSVLRAAIFHGRRRLPVPRA